jgi:hypothetical protein
MVANLRILLFASVLRGWELIIVAAKNRACPLLGRRVAMLFRDDTTLQIEANFPEPNMARAATKWND